MKSFEVTVSVETKSAHATPAVITPVRGKKAIAIRFRFRLRAGRARPGTVERGVEVPCVSRASAVAAGRAQIVRNAWPASTTVASTTMPSAMPGWKTVWSAPPQPGRIQRDTSWSPSSGYGAASGASLASPWVIANRFGPARSISITRCVTGVAPGRRMTTMSPTATSSPSRGTATISDCGGAVSPMLPVWMTTGR